MSMDPDAQYYDAGGIETIELIKAKLTRDQYIGYCLGSAMKYLSRANWKGKSLERDIEKALMYLSMLRDDLDKPDPAVPTGHERPAAASPAWTAQRQT